LAGFMKYQFHNTLERALIQRRAMSLYAHVAIYTCRSFPPVGCIDNVGCKCGRALLFDTPGRDTMPHYSHDRP
jgi:hypothetical protein